MDPPQPLMDRFMLRALLEAALLEDAAAQDLTTEITVPRDQLGRALVIAKQAGVICGLPFAEETYFVLEPRVHWMPTVMEGMLVAQGATIAHVNGPLHAILRGERVALNFLQRLSGIATATRDLVDQVAHTKAIVLDTRKTTPGLRVAERYAVRVGGGVNHRFNLNAGVLIKDNHIAALRARGDAMGDAVRAAMAAVGPATAVEVEVQSTAELEEALQAGARSILLDNFALNDLAVATERAHALDAVVEASGGITLETVAAVAETGVDFISSGAITHSAPALDISLQALPETLSGPPR